MWIGDSAYKKPEKLPLFFDRLREMGITAGMVHGKGSPAPLLENRFPYYVENVVNRGLCLKWNSNVKDWDKTVTDWAKGGRPESALVRDYCLDSPEWLAYAANEMRESAAKHAKHHPLAYNIRDELSTTISANPFDYDFTPVTLAKFRTWLQKQYGSLEVLNGAWETAFSSWDQVRPFTTDQIKERMASGAAMPPAKTDWQEVQQVRFDPAKARQQPRNWNLSPWCDFRSYMDLSLATALNHIRQAARQDDPHTPVGVEGTQMPHAFGGYDLWRLSQALDWVEPYDIGNAREIFGAFMRDRTLLTTVFEKGTDAARRRLWHLLLEGDRGCIIWWSEDCIDWQSENYALTPKARALSPVLKEMTSPLARLFLRARRVTDPVFIHYSQPSIQVDWLIESTVDGSTWLRRFSSYEADHNRMAKVRNSWVKAFQDLGYSPTFISSEELERGDLNRRSGSSNAVVVLPTSYALSDREAEELKGFVAMRPGTRRLFFDGYPGAFDGHGRLRKEPALPALDNGLEGIGVFNESGTLTTLPAEFERYQTARVGAKREALAWSRWINERLGTLNPEVSIQGFTCTRVHRFQTARARLIAFERNINYQMSEDLKQSGGNESLEKPVDLEATLTKKAHVYDLWTGRYLGNVQTLRFRLEPWRPSLFAITDKEIASEDLIAALE
jgi:hypothetical protein